MSPVTANVHMLSQVFNDADVKPDLNQERCALFDCDDDGEIEVDYDGINTFYQSEGYLYRTGQGREKCSKVRCLSSKEDVPNNCGFHQQFIFPVQFQPCSPTV